MKLLLALALVAAVVCCADSARPRVTQWGRVTNNLLDFERVSQRGAWLRQITQTISFNGVSIAVLLGGFNLSQFTSI